MISLKRPWVISSLILIIATSGCATSPKGRSAFSEDSIDEKLEQLYQARKSVESYLPLDSNHNQDDRYDEYERRLDARDQLKRIEEEIIMLKHSEK